MKRKFYFTIFPISIILLAFTSSVDLFEINKNIDIFNAVYREVNHNYVDDIKPGDFMKKGIDAMMSSLDPYTVYYPESQIEDVRFMQTGQYGGIGATIDEWEGKFIITAIDKNQPADKAGMKVGDLIKIVDGKKVDDLSYSELSKLVKGAAGTTVEISVVRKQEKIKLNIERTEIQVPDLPYYGMLDDEVGYIKLSSFTRTASKSVTDAFVKLQGKGMKRLMFDLRGNGGGLLKEAVNIVNLWVPKNIDLVSMKGRLSSSNKVFPTLNKPKDIEMPIVVLVDSNSASASEIVSASLQDLDRGIVVGNQSYGKGLVQQTRDVSYGGMIKVTVAKYYTPSGRCVQKLNYQEKDTEGHATELSEKDIKEFKTANGRVVYDGRGVDPDVVVGYEYIPQFVQTLVDKHIIFNWITNNIEQLTITDSSKFTLTDNDYKLFTTYVLNSKVTFENGVLSMLKDLETSASKEKITLPKSELESLKKELEINVSQNLIHYKGEIKRLIENEVVSRLFYEQGVTEFVLDKDQVVLKAKEILYDEPSYNSILGK